MFDSQRYPLNLYLINLESPGTYFTIKNKVDYIIFGIKKV